MAKKLLRIRPIIFFGHEGPMVAEVTIVAKELSLPHILQPITAAEAALARIRQPPLMYDPNGELYLAEPHAIVSYLVATYDDYLKISFRRDNDWFFLSDEWHSFQVNLMAITRFWDQMKPPQNGVVSLYFHREVRRGLMRLNEVLVKNLRDVLYMDDGKTPVRNGPWVVGNKMSFVDLGVCCWIYHLNSTSPEPVHSRWPLVSEWFDRVLSRGEVRTTFTLLMPRQ
ncbi:hypothetical protein F5X97DRAFT_303488 [Nemania serpens]|nr:hypothetical protein F5X97DRAFT_303488 [Nemania serpens]